MLRVGLLLFGCQCLYRDFELALADNVEVPRHIFTFLLSEKLVVGEASIFGLIRLFKAVERVLGDGHLVENVLVPNVLLIDEHACHLLYVVFRQRGEQGDVFYELDALFLLALHYGGVYYFEVLLRNVA